LEPVIRVEPHNIPAWLWYAETCSTSEARLKVLEVCLKNNPGNPQVQKALDILRSRQVPLQKSDPFLSEPEQKPAFASPFLDEPQEDEPQPASQASSWEVPASWQGASEDDNPLDFNSEPVPAIESKPAQPVWEYKPSQPDPEDEDEVEPVGRRFAWYDVWWTALTSRVEGYEALLRDPAARPGRAYAWVLFSGMIVGIVIGAINAGSMATGFEQVPEAQQLLRNASLTPATLGLGLVVCLTPLYGVFSLLGLVLSAGFQHLLAMLFGGKGTFARTAYALGAYLAPMGIISTIISIIPLVNCISPIVGIYSIVLNMRALQASERMNSMQALGVILLPGILGALIACIALAATWSSVGPEIMQYMQQSSGLPGY
jgi:hypothetical protein